MYILTVGPSLIPMKHSLKRLLCRNKADFSDLISFDNYLLKIRQTRRGCICVYDL